MEFVLRHKLLDTLFTTTESDVSEGCVYSFKIHYIYCIVSRWYGTTSSEILYFSPGSFGKTSITSRQYSSANFGMRFGIASRRLWLIRVALIAADQLLW